MKLLSIPGVARKIGRSDKWVREHQGQFPGAVVIGRRTLFREDAIDDFLKAGGLLGASAPTDSTSRVA
jgi:hypothetical protein